jgi:LPXTG-site transpeptidase (sortase) family protein
MEPTIQVAANPGLPVQVRAPSVGLDVSVSNPTDTDNGVLNNALLKGAVRYPTSAPLGGDGGVLLVGHSSYLPIVHNQNYKAFNHIKDLKNGATVSVYTDAAEYRYTVVDVRQGHALASTPEDVVELPSDGNGKYLVLVTCDSFGAKSDRYIVTAEFAGAYAR